MLRLHFGELDNVKYTGDGWFENQLGCEYLETEFSKSVIKRIDKSEVYDRNLIISPVLGGIPPERLSGGSKALICIKYTDWIFSITAMGENCYPILAEIAKEKDILMTCDSSVLLFKYGGFKEVYIENTSKIVRSDLELIDEILKCKGV